MTTFWTSGGSEDPRIQGLISFWNQVRFLEHPGETTWEKLEECERAVTEALFGGPKPDILLAESETARAMWLMAGKVAER